MTIDKKSFELNTFEIIDIAEEPYNYYLMRLSFVREEPLRRCDVEFSCARDCSPAKFASFLKRYAEVIEKEITGLDG